MPILASIFEDDIPSNSVVAFATEQLASMCNRIDSVPASTVELGISSFKNKPARDSKARIPIETSDEILEVGGTNGHVRIQIADKFRFDSFKEPAPLL